MLHIHAPPAALRDSSLEESSTVCLVPICFFCQFTGAYSSLLLAFALPTAMQFYEGTSQLRAFLEQFSGACFQRFASNLCCKSELLRGAF